MKLINISNDVISITVLNFMIIGEKTTKLGYQTKNAHGE